MKCVTPAWLLLSLMPVSGFAASSAAERPGPAAKPDLRDL